MEKYLAELNEAQRAPVLHKDGALMVIAGAGSGKTRVLTYRIAYLMSQDVDPFNILALTFTNKAAREMKERIGKIVGQSEARNLWMGTFHSIFARILREEAHRLGYPRDFTIYDQQDSQRLISSIIKEMGLDKDIYKYKQIASRISSFKNNLITVKAYFADPELQEADAMAKRPRLGDIYKNYVERCFKAGAMDFDDLLLKTNELLNVFPDVLAKYQNRFRYILVDEYQDTNHSQYLIVRALSDKFQNICVVGDDAQSIYAFRGANIDNILHFQKDYEKVGVYRLEQNYRSTKNIVEAANCIIEKNKTRLEKVVWTDNENGQKIKVHRSPTDADEGRFVASTIFDIKMREQLSNGHFAVLYRTNSQSRAIEDALRKRDIPYRIYGGTSFYQRKEIKDILAYFRLVINPKDEEALNRIINFPARGIGDTTMEKLTLFANEQKKSIFRIILELQEAENPLKISGNIKNRLIEFANMILSFRIMMENTDAFTLAEHIAKRTGILLEFKKDGTPEGIERMQNIEELLNGIRDFVEGQKEVDGSTGSLSEFLEDVALATDMDKEIDEDNRVSLMTIHLAKGLEFPYVFIVGMEEDLFPSALSVNTRTELEEERRLFYVALTRAEKQAYLTYTESRYRWGRLADAEPSRFIDEIDEKYLDFLTLKENNPNYRYKPLVNIDIFSEPDKSKLRLQKPINGTPPARTNKPNEEQLKKLRLQKPDLYKPTGNAEIPKVNIGDIIEHERFGRGKILNIEGSGMDSKANVLFDTSGEKTLILRFAKFRVI
ncbi:MAG: 3'-5' exonuclease [Capnocytophaga sp.]|nr:3'-5' exonuclease [Capnocytophaga sp.]